MLFLDIKHCWSASKWVPIEIALLISHVCNIIVMVVTLIKISCMATTTTLFTMLRTITYHREDAASVLHSAESTMERERSEDIIASSH